MGIKRLFSAIGLFCLLFSLVLVANAAEESPHATVTPERFTQGLLWKLEKDGEIVGHIFGTIHLNDSRVTKISDNLRKLLDSSKSFSMESFPGDIDDPTIGMARFREVMVFEDGDQNLRKVVGDDLYQRVVKLLVNVGFSEEQVLQLKPWMAMHSISIQLDSKGEVLDSKLLEIADKEKKNMFRLESPGEMVSSFYAMPMDAQTSLLEDAVNNYPNLEKTLNQMLEAYLHEDLQAMIDISTNFVSKNPDKAKFKETYLKHAIYNRNVVMQHYMRAPLREGNAFITVGALHLYGDKGVLALLEQDGFKLTRMPL